MEHRSMTGCRASTDDDHVAGLLAAVMRRGLKSVCETHFDPAETDINYCGIDLHSKNRVVIVSDDEDRIKYQKRVSNELALITAALGLIVGFAKRF
jgi:hypothetical protein